MRLIIVIMSVLVAMTFLPASATVINIPDDYPTIQEGIDASLDGDTVLVQPGMYVENINFNGHNIVLGSLFLITQDRAYISETIIDGDSAGSVVRFDSGEDSATAVTGFTIQNGSASGGGGVFCSDSNPYISDNILKNNYSSGYGGAIYLMRSSSTIKNDLIVKNTAYIGGTAIYCYDATPTIINCTICGNRTDWMEGAIYCNSDNMQTTVINSIIRGNIARNDIQVYGQTPVLRYCNIENGFDGEGNIDVNPMLLNPTGDNYNLCSQSPCIDAGDPNILDPDGSRSDIGVYFPEHQQCDLGNVWVVSVDGDDENGNGSPENPFRTIIKGIESTIWGDTVLVRNGVYQEQLDIFMSNLVVTSNFVYTDDITDIQNTVIDGDSSFIPLYVTKCDSQAVLNGLTITGGYSQAGSGIYCLYADPSISNSVICRNYVEQTGGGIYCQYSDPTIFNCTIRQNYSDGSGGGVYCYESSPSFLNSTIAANYTTGSGGGIVSFHNSIPILENSLIWGNDPMSIYNTDGDPPTAIYCDIQGGWEGEGNIDLNPFFVDPANDNFNVCLQSPCIDAGNPQTEDPDGTRSDIGVFYYDHPLCNIGNVWYVSTSGDDDYGDGSPENPLRTIQFALDISGDGDSIIVEEGTYLENLIFHDNEIVLGSLFLVDGDTSHISATMIDGNLSGSVMIFEDLEYGRPVVSGFTIENGFANQGGGIYCMNSDPTIQNNVIRNNTAYDMGEGGGIYCEDSELLIFNNTISGNQSDYSGGGIYCYESTPIIDGCTIRENTGKGAIQCAYSDAIISNNLIINNSGGPEGGGISCGGSNPVIINNTICDNTYTGIYSSSNSHPTIINNIFWYNDPDQVRGSPSMTYSCIDGGWEGEGNIYDNPLFVDRFNGNYNVYAQSPCIDAGDPSREDPDGTRSDIGLFFAEHPDFEFRQIWYVDPNGSDENGDGSPDSPFRTIQFAIDFSSSGDTIMVRNGIYEENIYIYSKSLLIASNYLFSDDTLDIQNTIIDGNSSNTVLTFEDCDNLGTITGFTVRNGDAVECGGLTCDNSDITIRNNIIRDNWGDTYGGIFCLDSSPLISNNIIIDNYGHAYGGGISLRNSAPIIINNTISGNSPGNGFGAGIYCYESNPTISDNFIVENSRRGIHCENSNLEISHNYIIENSIGIGSPEWGGIYCENSSGEITQNVIWRNGGPGIKTLNSNFLVLNNTICRNHKTYYGENGGGIDSENSDLIIKNNIIRGNVWPQLSGVDTLTSVSYCDVEGGWDGEGNIDAKPLFIDPSNGDYNICIQSPCIDAGDPDVQDPDGSRSDIGVFFATHPECEFGNKWYVSISGDDEAGDGSIENPFRTIQHAIDVSFHSDSIIVENGTYVENINFNSKDLLLGSNYIFSGDSSDIQTTIIDGDSSYTTIIMEFCDSLAILSGFTIRNGLGHYSTDYGGGVHCAYSNSEILNNIITSNGTNSSEGGAISCWSSNLAIEGNMIIGNFAVSGGGVYCEDSRCLIADNYINGNTISSRGGGIYLLSSLDSRIDRNNIIGNNGSGIFSDASDPSINSNIILDNSGGGIRSDGDSSIFISNNIIARNSSEWHGGGIYSYRSGQLILNNVITENTSDRSGGGIYGYWSNLQIVNSIIRGNSAVEDSNEIFEYLSSFDIIYSDILGGWEGEGNVDIDPLFQDPENSNFHLMSTACGDPYDSPCIDAGDPSIFDSILDCDWGLGEERSDMGAYGGGDSTLVGIDDDKEPEVPIRFGLSQNFPNPFNASTIIQYSIPTASNVTIEIYDILGRKVETLVQGEQPAGYHQVRWDANDHSSGMYFYRIQAGEYTKTRKMVLLK